MGFQGEDKRAGGNNKPEPVLELIRTGLSRDVLLWLHNEGSAKKETLLSEVALAGQEHVSDHDRVRLAVELEMDVLYELEEHDLVHRDGEEISLGFLPPSITEELETMASSQRTQ